MNDDEAMRARLVHFFGETGPGGQQRSKYTRPQRWDSRETGRPERQSACTVAVRAHEGRGIFLFFNHF
jgi:hypothetical protein